MNLLRRNYGIYNDTPCSNYTSANSTPSISFNDGHMCYEGQGKSQHAYSYGCLSEAPSSIGVCSPLDNGRADDEDEDYEEQLGSLAVQVEGIPPLRRNKSSLANLLKAVTMGEQYSEEHGFNSGVEGYSYGDSDTEDETFSGEEREDCRFYPSISYAAPARKSALPSPSLSLEDFACFADSANSKDSACSGQLSKRLAPNFSCIVREACDNNDAFFSPDRADAQGEGAEDNFGFGGRYAEVSEADDWALPRRSPSIACGEADDFTLRPRSKSAPIAIPLVPTPVGNRERFLRGLQTPSASVCRTLGVELLDRIEGRARLYNQAREEAQDKNQARIRRIRSEPVVMRCRGRTYSICEDELESEEEDEEEEEKEECLFSME